MKPYFTYSVLLICSAAITALPAPPSSNSLQFCPASQDSNGANNSSFIDDGKTQMIDLSKIEGKKVKIQFYSTNTERPTERSEDTTVTFPYKADSTNYTTVSPTFVGGNTEVSQIGSSSGAKDTSTAGVSMDILCHWEFRASNESEYLLLTFDNLSAPYSIDCADAYVAMQKDNGYESRWCGNRRQANARPMALFSKTSAKITVFRKGNAPSYPQTGFSVAVESLAIDVIASSGVENSLRVLLG